MLILKTKSFAKWARKEKLNNAALKKAVHEIEQGLVDANLGGYLFKKRVAIGSKGKSGGCRTIVAYKVGEMLIYLEGFSKSEKSNISSDEIKALQKLAKLYFGFTSYGINKAIDGKELEEIK